MHGKYCSEANLALNAIKTKWMILSTPQMCRIHALHGHIRHPWMTIRELMILRHKLSTLLQDANNLFQICQTTGNKLCERILSGCLLIWSAWWTDLFQLVTMHVSHWGQLQVMVSNHAWYRISDRTWGKKKSQPFAESGFLWVNLFPPTGKLDRVGEVNR